MKTMALPLAATLLLVGMGVYLWHSRAPLSTAQAQDADKKEDDRRGTLTTNGTSTAQVKPDSARVFFRVESYAKEIKAARSDNAKQVKGIIDALDKLQIEGLKMKSTDVNVRLVTRREEDDGRLPEVLGYHVTYSFTVLTENENAVDLAKDASRVLDAALENGATGVDQIHFFAKDLEAVRRDLLTKAVEDGLVNARAMAAGAKRTIDEISMIYGQPDYSGLSNNIRQNADFGGGGGDSTQLVAGDLVLKCSVNVSCKYAN